MIVRINGKIVDFVKGEDKGWNNVTVPSVKTEEFLSKEYFIEQTNQTREFLNAPSFDKALNKWVESVDVGFYKILNDTEVTEFMYRFSKWSVSETLTILGVI